MELNKMVEAPLTQLDDRGKELTAATREGYLNPERLLAVQQELRHIAFELWRRYEDGEITIEKTIG